MNGILDSVWLSIQSAEVTADTVREGEARRNAFLDLLLEIAAPCETDLEPALPA